MVTDEQVLAKAKTIAPWFWPTDPWSVDLSCAQGQQRTLSEARRILEGGAQTPEYLQHRLYHWYPHSDHRTRILELFITDDYGKARHAKLPPDVMDRQSDLWLKEMWAEWVYFNYDLLYRD